MDKRKQNDMDNLTAKANACRADLRYLLTIVPDEWTKDRDFIQWLIDSLDKPTEEKINAAWQRAAEYHELIRKHENGNNRTL